MNVLPAPDSQLHGRPLWPARTAWVLILALIVSMLVINAPTNVVYARLEYQIQQARWAILSFTSLQTFAVWLVAVRWLVVTIYFAVALLIAWRKWNDWFALGVSAVLLLLAWGFVMRSDHNTWLYPRLLLQAVPATPFILAQLPLLGLVLLFFLFPDGRFILRWHRWFALLSILATVLFFYGDENRLLWRDYRPLLEQWAWPIWVTLLLVTLLIALAGQVYRYRHVAIPAQQQQMKWVLLGLASMLSIPLLSWPLEDTGGAWGALAAIGLELAAATFLPLTIGFSILRYRLWDVDLLINRTLVYGALTAVIVTLYGLSVGITNLLLPAQNNWLISALALGMAVPLVAPARHRLQRLADRWLPVPVPAVLSDGAVSDRGQGTPALRLVQASWVLLFAFLLWQLVAQYTTVQNALTAIASEWIVQVSLPALPGVSVNAFVRYLLMMRIAVIAIFWGTAVLVYWHRHNDNMALFVAFFLLLAPLSFTLSGDENRLEQWLVYPVIGLMALLPFLFPDGRFIPQSTRWRALLLLIVLATPFLAYPFATLAWPEYQPAEWVYASFIFTVAVTMAAGLGSQIYRYNKVATAVERQQTKWVLLGLGLPLLWIGWLLLWLVGLLARLGISEPLFALVMIHLSLLALATLPLTIGLSILRYRLWDIDLFINRTLVFAGLTLLVAAVYVLVVGLFGVLFQTGANLLLSILATGLIAILLNPLRQRLQQGVNRLMYGERDDPVAVLARLGERLEHTVIPSETLSIIVETIAQTLKLPYVAIAAQEDKGSRARSESTEETADEIVAAHGRAVEPATSFTLAYQGQSVGQLIVASRGPGETFTTAEMRLLRNVARQAGAAVYAAQLTIRLQRSRQRLVAAREEERRRIRRDLHDGLGPQLATLTLKVDAARNLLPSDPAAAGQLLAEIKTQSQDAVREIRRVVEGLRPPVLDQLGLVPALREYAAQHSNSYLRVTVEAPEPLPLLPAAVEVAAYHIAAEAVTNATRHAMAQSCTVRLKVTEKLVLEIHDDGVGLAAGYQAGIGLSSMRERAAELGGTCRVDSHPGEGTHIVVTIPLYTHDSEPTP